MIKLDYIVGERRQGRVAPLSAWKKAFKHQWDDMSRPDEYRRLKKEIRVLKTSANTTHTKKRRAEELQWIRDEHEREPGTYHTDVLQWTCSCPSYLLNRFLLCKHLVRAVQAHFGDAPQDREFFSNLQRRYHPPYYFVEGLHDARYASGSDDAALAIRENMHKEGHRQNRIARNENDAPRHAPGVDHTISNEGEDATKSAYAENLRVTNPGDAIVAYLETERYSATATQRREAINTYLGENQEAGSSPSVPDPEIASLLPQDAQPGSANEVDMEANCPAIDQLLSSDPFDDLDSDELKSHFDESGSVADGLRDDARADDADSDGDDDDDDDKECEMRLLGIKRWQCVDGVGRVGPKQPH
jgi:hypothetical protein